MADFFSAVNLVLRHEGGYTPGLPGDPGGETNFGISKRCLAPDVRVVTSYSLGKMGVSTESNSGSLFEKFWSSYPRKTHKSDALRSWKRLRVGGDLFRIIMVYLDAWKKTKTWSDPDRYEFIPYPASWLAAKTWKDDPKATAAMVKQSIEQGDPYKI